MPPQGDPKPQPIERKSGDMMADREKIKDAISPLENIAGIPFQNVCSDLFGDQYYSIKEAGKSIRELMLKEARKRGFGQSLDLNFVEGLVKKHTSPPPPALDIKELEEDFRKQVETNPDFEVASTHPEDVPYEGLKKQKPLPPPPEKDK